VYSLIKYFESDYFFNLASFIIGISGYFASFKINRRNGNLYLFKYYFLSYVVCTLAVYLEIISLSYSPKTLFPTIRYTDLLFTFSEFFIPIVFFQRLFINRAIESNAVVLVKYTFLLVTSGLLLFNILRPNELTSATIENIFTLQALCLLVPCVCYYRLIFLGPLDKGPILQTSEFWIVTGITFFMLCTLPFSLLTNLLKASVNMTYIIFDIFYCLLFVMFIRAFSCKSVNNSFAEKNPSI
jgi:hypothetical protein